MRKKQSIAPSCTQCNKPVPMEIYAAQVINSIACSLIVLEHPAQVTCPSCGFTVTAQIANLQLQIVAVPVPEDAIEKKVIPASKLVLG